MPRRPLIKRWTDSEVDQLKALIENGANALQAAAALKRNMVAVQKKARELGKELPGVRKVRAGIRSSGAL